MHGQVMETPTAKSNPRIGFAENKGQIINQFKRENKNVLYLLSTSGLNVQLRKEGFSYDFYETAKVKDRKAKAAASPDKQNYSAYKYISTLHRIDFNFENTSPSLKIETTQKTASYNNYYTSKSAALEKVYSYKKVIYKNLYDGIDLVFSIPEDSNIPVEYNFIIGEKGNINDIQFRVSGAKNQLKDNTIEFKLRFGTSQETIPLSWMESATGKKNLAITYRNISKNVYGFSYNGNINGLKVIIDPVPIRLWGTYFGGYDNVFPMATVTDNLNNVFVSGTTLSISNVATDGAFQSTFIEQGGSNGYISKLSPDGVQLWGTYYPVIAAYMAVDSDMNLLFSGETSQNHPNVTTLDSYQPVKNAASDCFVVKLNSDGQRIWGTYFGGNGGEQSGEITTDADNNIYLSGETGSSQQLSTPGSHQQTKAGQFDGFLAKFSPAGIPLWSTYFGGSMADGLSSVEVAYDNSVYVTGTTNSAGLGTPGSYKPDWNGTPEIYIGKFDSDGTLLWSTYAGGEGFDYIFRSEIRGNNLYLQGRTSSSNGIATPGSFRPYFSPAENVTESYYIIAFDTQEQTIKWGTYFSSQITGIATNQNEELLFCGDTSQNYGIATLGSYMPVKDLYSKSYLIKLGAVGERIWGTYYGGDKAEQLCYLAIDTLGDIYMHGMTNGSMSGIATPGAHQSSISPDNFGAAYLVKFRDCNSFSTISSNSPVCIGQNIILQAQGGTNYLWTGPDNFSSIEANPTINNANPLKGGIYSCYISGTQGCDITQTIEVEVGDIISPIPSVATLPDLTANCSITVSQIPTALDGCDGILNATTADPLVYNVSGNYIVHWTYTDSSGNSIIQEQKITVTFESDATAPSITLYRCVGEGNFNLSQAQPLITPQLEVIFSYYNSESDALQGINPIISITSYLTDVDKQLFVISTFPNGCKSLSILYLSFNGAPYIPELKIEKCFGNSYHVFDLTNVVPLFNPDNEYTVLYYDSLEDMEGNIPISNIHNYSTTAQSHTIYIKAINDTNCISTGTLELNALQATEIELPEHLLCAGKEPVVFDLTCYNEDVFSALPADTYTLKYYDNYTDAANGTQNTIDPVLNFASGLKTFFYSAQGSNSICPYIVKHTIGFIENPKFELKDEYGICQGQTLELSLPGGFYDYKWSNGSNEQTATFSESGKFSATVFSMSNNILCETTVQFSVNIYDKPAISNVIIADFTESNNTITILPYNEDFLYSIDGVSYQHDNTFQGLNSGIYTVFVKDKAECGIASEKIILLNYPKYFSPNNDGQTDYWHIKNSFLSEVSISIYDRYGKLLHTINQNDKGWDGTFNGRQMPATDYWFVIKREGIPEYKGHFSLLR